MEYIIFFVFFPCVYLDNLRKKFISYKVIYTHKVKLDVNVMEILNQFDGEIHDHLEKLIYTARDVYLLNDADVTPTGDGHDAPRSEESS